MLGKRIVLALLSVVCVGAVGFGDNPNAKKTPPLVKEIAGYKSWTRVNREPHFVLAQTAALCAPPMPSQGVKSQADTVHGDKFVVVYVNDLGKKAMMQPKKPKFPVGSVVVKEKLASRENTSPELMTVMIKREAGYNPESGDWEYLVTDGAGATVKARGKLESCQSCHNAHKDTDFTFRSYVSFNSPKQAPALQ